MGHVTPLYREANRWLALPTVWGQSDCIMVLADWVESVTGRDFAADLRCTYNDALSAERACGWLSDPVGCIASRVEPELERVEEPTPGDVAILQTIDERGRPQHTGGLYLRRSWLCKAPMHGATEIARARAVAIWGVPYDG